jgi:hypothetical protein
MTKTERQENEIKQRQDKGLQPGKRTKSAVNIEGLHGSCGCVIQRLLQNTPRAESDRISARIHVERVCRGYSVAFDRGRVEKVPDEVQVPVAIEPIPFPVAAKAAEVIKDPLCAAVISFEVYCE